MKFECPECHAKYQIADEKIRGRTLKMDCRRCQHRISIRGSEEQSSPASHRPGVRNPPPAGARRSSGSQVGPLPRRNRISGVAPPPQGPPKKATGPQWHVAINDVPVGPIGLEELSKKVAAGAVNESSLCWREGFTDWKPVGEVAELAELLRPQPQAKPEPPPKAEPRPGGVHRTQPSRPGIPAAKPPSPSKGAFPSPASPRSSQPGRAAPSAASAPPRRAMPAPRSPFGAGASAKASATTPESRPEPMGAKVVPITGRSLSAAPALEERAPAPVEEEPAAEPTADRLSDPASGRHSDLGLDFAEPVVAEPAKKKKKSAKEADPRESAKKDAVQDFFGGDAVELRDSIPTEPRDSQQPAAVISAEIPGVTASPAASPAAQPAVAKEEKEEKKGGLPVGAWIGIVGAGAFGIALAVLVAPALVSNPDSSRVSADSQPAASGESSASALSPEQVTPEANAQAGSEEQASAETVEGEAAGEGSEEGSGEASEEVSGEVSGEGGPPPTTTVGGSGGGSSSGARHASSTGSTSGSASGSASGAAAGGRSQAESAPDPRFDRFEDDTAEEAPIRAVSTTRPNTGASSSGPAAPALTSSQISAVVVRERQGLRRCYETAMRQTGQARTVRMDVDLTIGSGGGVVSVRARGQSLGNMSTCIESLVRRWRFPSSGDQSRTSFPIVFAGQD